MKRSGIPASVTLAQGILESANGNSMLARKGNNHFGIKCHKAWRGKKVFAFDDGRSSCFRKYRSDYTSYIDHSNFLHNNPRYGSLFNLSETDYEAWCKGLKKAGYATNPKYAKRLIAIIKMYNLHEFDVQTDPGFCKEAVFAVPSTYNGIKTVIFNCRVTPYLVARAYKITESKIIEYNNLYINDTIPANT
ncbi:MAG: glycoside hydrolase family 73 protein, partial [Chitinophagales bacterium]